VQNSGTSSHFSVSLAMSLPKSAADPGSTKVGKPRLHLGVGEARIDLLVELVDDLGWRVLGRTKAIELPRLVARHEVTHGRDVWQPLPARRGGYRERTQLAGP
jgi:hypothetical protein